MGQGCYRIVVLLNQVLALATEVERFWMVRSHVLDLLSDGNDRLVLLHLELADAEIGEACQFESMELCHSVLEFFRFRILAQEVVINVAKVEVPIHFLVNFGGLCMIS